MQTTNALKLKLLLVTNCKYRKTSNNFTSVY